MITRKFLGTVARSMDAIVNEKINVELSWDPDTDPLAVTMICTLPPRLTASGKTEEVVWIYGRDLLAEGLKSLTPYGEGDVKMRLASEAGIHLIICLTSPEGHADLLLPTLDTRAFLGATRQHTEIGHEEFADLLDDFLKEFDR